MASKWTGHNNHKDAKMADGAKETTTAVKQNKITERERKKERKKDKKKERKEMKEKDMS